MMDALQSYSGEESASEDHPKEEDDKSDQEDGDEPIPVGLTGRPC
jgi:hypothetical protein